MKCFTRCLLAVVLPATFMISMSATAAHAAATLVVDDNLTQCPTAGFTTISSAVAAASPGDTIQVCPGIYSETVNVDKSLHFVGAKAGVDARSGRTAVGKESVVIDLNGGFIIPGGVNGVTIDGFTIQGAGSDATTADGIEDFQGGNGITVVNNIIQNNEVGINLQNPDSSQPALIQHNRFVNNNNGTTANGGTGVFISNGPANSTTIEQNRFTGHRETAINFAGDSNNHSVGLVVEGNTSVNDATFVVATASDNALIDGNAITYNLNSGNGTAILDFGGNNALRITDNTIKGGADTGTSGINIAAFAGASSGTTVTSNVVTGRNWGIRVKAGVTTAFVSHNRVVSSAQVGIRVEASAGPGNVMSRNNVKLSVNLACEDDTTGSGTLGTANTWTHNRGNGSPSTPVGICP